MYGYLEYKCTSRIFDYVKAFDSIRGGSTVDSDYEEDDVAYFC